MSISGENGLQAISGPLRRLSILSLRSRNSVHISSDEILLLDDCKKMVRDVNKSVAALKSLLLMIGSYELDSPDLRDDIRKVQKKALDFSRKAKTRMLPAIKNTMNEQQNERNDQLRKYFYQLFLCMRTLLVELRIAYQLQKQFPIKCIDSYGIMPDRPSIVLPAVTCETIQITISTPANEEITLVPTESETRLDRWIGPPCDITDPELNRTRSEAKELIDMLTEVEEVIPRKRIPDDADLNDDFHGRKVKTRPRRKLMDYRRKKASLLCCTCRTEYI